MNSTKRIIAMILCIVMFVTILPAQAMAEELQREDNSAVFAVPETETETGEEPAEVSVTSDTEAETDNSSPDSTVPAEDTPDTEEAEAAEDVSEKSEDAEKAEESEEEEENEEPEETGIISPDGWIYRVEDGYAVIMGHTDHEVGILTVPLTVGGYEVRAIGENAFSENEGLNKLFIHGNVTMIAESAFSGKSLRLFGYSGSETLRFAETYGFPFTNSSTTENYAILPEVIDFTYVKNTGRYQIIDGNTIHFGMTEALRLSVGSVFYLEEFNADGLIGISAVVERIVFDEGGAIVTVSAALSEQVYEWIYISEENLEVDWDNAIWEDWVEVLDEKIEIEHALTGNAISLKLEKKINDNFKFAFKGSLTITGGITLDYSVLKHELNKFSFYVQPKFHLEGGFYGSGENGEEVELNPKTNSQKKCTELKTLIGFVPFWSVAVASLGIDLYLKMSVDGEVTISGEVSGKIGMEYNKATGLMQGIREFSRPVIEVHGKVEACIGPAAALTVKVVGLGQVLEFEFFAGIQGTATAKLQYIVGSGDAQFCIDVKASLVISAEFELKLQIGKSENLYRGYKHKLFEITIGEWSSHFEPFLSGWKYLDHCTYGNEVSFCTFSSYTLDPVTVKYGDRVSQPVIDVKKDKNGKYLNEVVGWYKDKGLTQQWNFGSDAVLGDMTLYAKWKLNARLVTFDMDSKTQDKTISVYPYTKIIEQPKPMVMQERFEGWFTDKNYTKQWVFDADTMPDKDITLYAKFTHDDNYNPFTAASGSSGTTSDGRMSYNGHYYKHVAEYVSYSTAKQIAESQGGYLVTITSPGEMEAVQRYAASDCAQEALWLGISKNTNWNYWLNGEKATDYENWQSDPNRDNDYYGTMIRTSGKWVAAENSATRHYIIEWGDYEVDPGFKSIDTVDYTKNNNGKESSVSGVNVSGSEPNVFIDTVHEDTIVTSIEDYALTGNIYLETIDIPNTVTSIGTQAFKDCTALKEIIIPASVTSIGAGAFEGCTALEKVFFQGEVNIPANCFKNCKMLKSIVLDDVHEIGSNAFDGCTSLEKVSFSKDLKTVGSNAFANCTSLKSVSLPESAVNLGTGIFYGCTAAETTFISRSISQIPANMYANCTGLKEVTVIGEKTQIGSGTFANVSAVFRGYVDSPIEKWCEQNGQTFEDIQNRAFVKYYGGKPSLGQTTTGGGTITKDGEFDEYQLAYIGERLPEPVIECEGFVIEGWYRDAELTDKWDFATDLVTETEFSLFARWVEADDSFRYSINNGAVTITGYKGDSTSVDVPETIGGYPVTTLGETAFANIYGVAKITLPASLQTIVPGAFFNCVSLIEIDASRTAAYKTVNGVLFSADGSELVCMPGGITVLQYTVSDGVQKIDKYAFADQAELIKVEIPDSVTEIQSDVFTGNYSLVIYGSDEDCAAKRYAEENSINYNRYKVSFIIDGEVLSYETVNAGDIIDYYMIPEDENMSYGGWYKDIELTQPWDFENDVMPAADISLYLKWEYEFTYENSENGIVITGYSGSDTVITIPHTINNLPVVGIRAGALTAQSGISGVIVPSSVTDIEDGAIVGVAIIGDVGSAAEAYAEQNNLSFEQRAYTLTYEVGNGSPVEAITLLPGEEVPLPETIRTGYNFVGWYTTVFQTNKWPDDGVMPASDMTLYAGWKAIESGRSDDFIFDYLEDGTISISRYSGDKIAVTIPSTINGAAVTAIGAYAFDSDKNVMTVIIPDSVTSIGKYAFSNSAVTTITGGTNVESLGANCFMGCKSLRVPFITDKMSEIPAYCFSGCTAITDVVIPENITAIGEDAFSDCIFLDELTVPESVAYIGDYAFAGCKRLARAELPMTLKDVQDNVFANVTRVTYYATEGIRILNLKQTTKSSVHIEWNAVEGNTEYYLYRKQGSAGSYQLIKSVSGTETDNFNLQSGVTYYFKVKAKTTGAESDEYSIRLSQLTTSEIAEVSASSENTATMKITAVNGAAGYEIWRAYEENGDYSLLKTVNETEFTNSGLLSNRRYYYKVRAFATIDGIKEYSAWSDVYRFDMPAKFMAQPENLIVRENAKNTAYLTWDPVEGADGYTVYRQKGNANWVKVKTVAVTEAYSYNLTTGETFNFKVSAFYYDGSAEVNGDTCAPVAVKMLTIPSPAIKSITQSAHATALVSWSSISNITGYELWRGRSVGGPYYLMKSVDGTATSNYNLEIGSTYYYKVRAYSEKDGVKEYGEFSQPASLTIGELSMTRIKSVEAQNGNSAKIVWAAVTNAESYEVWRSTADNSHYEIIRSTGGTAISDKDLADGQTYFYKIRALKTVNGEAIYGAFSDEMSVRIIATPVLKVLEQNSANSVLLMWSSVPSADGYEILRCSSSGGTYTVAEDVSANNAVIYGMNEGTTAYFKIRAYTKDANGKKSVGFNSNYMGIKVLGIPEITSLTQNGADGVKIVWSTVKNAEAYELWRSVTRYGGYEKVKSVTGTNTTSFGLEADKQYYYKLVATCKLNGTTQRSAFGTPVGINILATPAIELIEQLSPASCQLSWGAVKNAEAYKVYRSDSENGTYSLVKTVAEPTAQNFSLNAESRYFYKVKAVLTENGEKHESAFSPAGSIYITNMSAPTLKDVSDSETAVDVSWNAIPGAEGYEVWRCNYGGSYALVEETDSTVTEYSDTSVSANITYIYKVRAFKAVDGERAYSAFSKELDTGLVRTGSYDNINWVQTGSKLEFFGTGAINNSFANNSYITEVIIHDGITRIGSNAFENDYKLEHVEIPDSVTSIYSYSFRNCYALTEITLPAGIAGLNSYTFQNSGLSKIVIPDKVTGISNYAFDGCTKLEEVTFNAKLQTIGSYAFRGCSKLKEITVPEGVTSIGSYAFAGCSALADITIPGTVSSIDDYAFNGTAVHTAGPIGGEYDYQYGWTRKIPDYAFARSNLVTIDIENVRNVGNYAAFNCTLLRSVAFGDGVEEIGTNAFASNAALTDIQFADSLEIIGSNAFQNDSALKKIELPDSVISINANAFQNCAMLSDVSFGSGLKYIYSNAFESDTKLTSIVIPEGTVTIDSYAFANCTGISSVILPESVATIGQYAFYNTNLHSVGPKGGEYDVQYSWIRDIPSGAFRYMSSLNYAVVDGIRNIGSYAFADCTALGRVEMGDSVEVINNSAFRNDTNLYVVSFGSSIEYIYDNAFRDDTKLNNIVLPEGVMTLGNYAFYNCTSLRNMYVPGSVANVYEYTFYNTGFITAGPAGQDFGFRYGWTRTIPSYAFSRMTNLRTAVVEGARNLNSYAFYNCTNLQNVIIGDSVELIGESAFRYDTALNSVSLGRSIETISSYAFDGNNSLTSVVLPDSLKNLYSYAFSNCANLESVRFGRSLKIIGASAFQNDVKLNDVVIPDGVTTIENNAFNNCTSLSKLTVPGSVTSVSEYSFSNIATKTAGPIGGEYDYQYGWTRTIPAYAFSRISALNDIVFGNGIRTVGSNACYYCTGLVNVEFSDSVETINSSAFRYASNIESITFGKGLETIGDYAFQNNTKLNNVVLPNGLLTIGNYAFSGCTALKNLVVPGSVKTVNEYSFSGIGVKSAGPIGGEYDYQYGWTVTIPDFAFSRISALNTAHIGNGVSNINSSAFRYCTNLTTVTMEDSVETIGINAFQYDTKLESVSFGSGLKNINGYAFNGDTKLNNVVIHAGVTFIGDYAFSGCTALKNIVVPDTVKSIYENTFSNIAATTAGPIGGEYDYQYGWTEAIPVNAFSRIYALTAAHIGNGVKYINGSAFRYCTNLTTVTMEDSVEKIFSYAFAGDTNLQNVTFGNGLQVINANAFNGDTKLNNVIIPDGVTSILANAFDGCTALKNLVVPGTVTEIGENAFRNIAATTAGPIGGEYDYQYGWTSAIPMYAFSRIYALTAAHIGNGVKYINGSAFRYCTNLTTVTMEDSVEKIFSYAFADDTKLQNVTFGDGLQIINVNAFQGDTKLNNVIIPDGVTSILANAFDGCTALKNLIVPGTVTEIGENAFRNIAATTAGPIGGEYDYQYGWTSAIPMYAFSRIYALTAAHIGNGVKYINGSAFRYCTNLTTVTMEDSVEKIFSYAFADDTKLQNVTFGDGLQIIYGYAFQNDSKLNNVVLPATVTSIENYAFGSCSALSSITFEGPACTIGNYAFNGITATAYYPIYEQSWTSSVRQSYGAKSLTWETFGELGSMLSLRVNTMPNRTAYEIGVPFDATGLTLAAAYECGHDLIIPLSDITVSDVDTSTKGDKTVTASYNGMSVNFTIHVDGIVAITVDPEVYTYPESNHNYQNNANQSWTFNYPNAVRLEVNFSSACAFENGYDHLYVYDSNGTQIGDYTGSALASQKVSINGSSFSLRLTSDGSITNYGFAIDSIIAFVPED